MMKKVVLFDIDYTLFDTEKFKGTNLQTFALYKEAVDVLEKLKDTVYLGIFSEGNLDLQKTKLIKTKIHSSFTRKHIHIVVNKEERIEQVLKKYKNCLVFLVDDKLTVLCQAKKLLPSLVAIWVKRGIYAEKQLPINGFTPDAIIENLRELIPIILKDK
ncbi:MAG: hypothetical protein HYV37_02690 [Candidatus Levyibacteriota bacterium]|nr:MAG: hypothetical protein HYV37_02690 [Candidatus Levybacteria bacterium]